MFTLSDYVMSIMLRLKMISQKLVNFQRIFLRTQTVMCNKNKEHSNSTVDENEIHQHNKVANQWWDPFGPMKGLHAMNKIRIELIRNGLINEGILKSDCVNSRHPFKGIKILDIGCGGGILSIPLSRLGAEVTGIDASRELIGVAQSEVDRDQEVANRIKFIETTIEDHMNSFKENYDAIVLSEVIEHVTKKAEFLEASVATLKPGGSLFVTTLGKTLASWSLSIIAAEYIMGLLPKGTHQWDKLVSSEDMKKLLETVGCRTRLINGLIYIPMQNKWIWIPYDGVHYGLHAVKEK